MSPYRSIRAWSPSPELTPYIGGVSGDGVIACKMYPTGDLPEMSTGMKIVLLAGGAIALYLLFDVGRASPRPRKNPKIATKKRSRPPAGFRSWAEYDAEEDAEEDAEAFMEAWRAGVPYIAPPRPPVARRTRRRRRRRR